MWDVQGYSQILCGGSAKSFRFGLVCIDLVANLRKIKILKQSCKDLFIWTELSIGLINYRI